MLQGQLTGGLGGEGLPAFDLAQPDLAASKERPKHQGCMKRAQLGRIDRWRAGERNMGG
jgi:hypothetical protein